ncbi:MAG: SEL1-like repeat protein [Rhodospirillales bacterium]|nr:SEL1-like repeat protein [Alphaproteobacteria bacterium]MCB9977468.1 SEL1-like repeat protein [Rhodospirillales bacterium]
MAFKRTSEGRVFFKSTEDDNKPTNGNGGGAVHMPEPSQADQNQMQILILLKSLNSKLLDTQEERAVLKEELQKYRAELKALEEKARHHEQSYIDLEQKVAAKQNETFKKASRVEETMKETARELEQARKLVEALEGRSQDSEDVIKSIREDLSQRKKLEDEILNIQKSLEQQQKEQSDKMAENLTAFVAMTKRMGETEARQEALDNKIEEATSEFLKLDRKINKAIEDRSRLLRKIERMEETVQETRDALNAKAMVLLTSQGRMAAADYAQITDGSLGPEHFLPGAIPDGQEQKSFWGRHFQLDPASITMIVVIGLLLGWMLSEIRRPQNLTETKPAGQISWTGERALPPPDKMASNDTDKYSGAESPSESAEPDSSSEFASVPEAVESKSLPQPEAIAEDASSSSSLPSETEAATEVAEAPPIPLTADTGEDMKVTPEAIDQAIEAEDDKTLMAAMEKNPDALADRLNEIEPSSLSSEDMKDPSAAGEQEATESQAAPEETTSGKSLRERLKPDPNLPEKLKRIETDAFNGIKEAQHDMGAIYVAGDLVKRDLNRAVFWFQEAADNGVANAKYNLGVLYHQGLGVKADLNKALSLYSEAAEMGHPEAQYNLGIAYIGGIGFPYDPVKAARNFESSANKGVKEAAYNLGLIYENGLLGKPQPDEALMWYKQAADQGSPEAKAALEQLAQSLGITLTEVNRIVDSVRAAKYKDAPSSLSSQKKPQAKADPEYPVQKNSIIDARFSGQQKLVAEIQSELMKRGLYPGPVDGQIGPVTTDAIRTYQTASNMDVIDGKPTQALLSYMKTSSVSE